MPTSFVSLNVTEATPRLKAEMKMLSLDFGCLGLHVTDEDISNGFSFASVELFFSFNQNMDLKSKSVGPASVIKEHVYICFEKLKTKCCIAFFSLNCIVGVRTELLATFTNFNGSELSHSDSHVVVIWHVYSKGYFGVICAA